MDDPVAPVYLDELRAQLPDFVRAYEPDGLTPAEFDSYGATARTLRGFIASYQELLHQVTDALIPNPDKKH
jgi:transaldolase